jgi:hypothetical protein
MMNSRDVNFILGKCMRPLISQDPYNDDYYFHKFVMDHPNELKNEYYPPPAPILPVLPLPRETSNNLRNYSAVTSSYNQYRLKEWCTDNRVLGSLSKKNFSAPRPLLDMSSLDPEQEGEEEEEGKGGESKGTPFSSKLWKARRAVVEANRAILRLNELLLQPLDPLLEDEIEETTKALGIAVGVRFGETGQPSLNGPSVSALARLNKGLEVFGKSLFFFPPALRWELMTALLQILCRLLKPPAEGQGSEKPAVLFLIRKMRDACRQQPRPGLSSVTRALTNFIISETNPVALRASIRTRERMELILEISELGEWLASQQPQSEEDLQEWQHVNEMLREIMSIQETAEDEVEEL